MITTTLNRIFETTQNGDDGRYDLLCGLGKVEPDDEPLSYSTILRICGLDGTIHWMQAEPGHALKWRLFAVMCARRILCLIGDDGPKAALDVAERNANGLATDNDLEVARRLMLGTPYDAASYALLPVPAEAARASAWFARRERGREALTRYTSYAAAMDAERAAQSEILLDIVGRE